MAREYQMKPAPGQNPPPAPVELTDDSMMPFGKHGPHKGDPRKMKDVPVKWLSWYWTQPGVENNMKCPVAAYIRKNLRALAKEDTDTIW